MSHTISGKTANPKQAKQLSYTRQVEQQSLFQTRKAAEDSQLSHEMAASFTLRTHRLKTAAYLPSVINLQQMVQAVHHGPFSNH